ncbi:major facilitator superfamily domain-containing protein [Hysterangium stoloniferum]|nr:major facilitator superfamily domain-containing protein [Hysterangium stoloniferum]
MPRSFIEKIDGTEKFEQRSNDGQDSLTKTSQSVTRSEKHPRHLKVEHNSPEERALVRRYDLRVMPIMCLLYLFAYLDRTNLGNARLQGLPQDILGGDKSGELFDWVNSAFFFSYILFQVPATVIMKLFSPRIWLGCVAIGWSICSVLMAASFNLPGIIVCRVGLGVFEAGFGPAVPLYLSFFYTKSELGLRMAYWFGFAAVAGAFGGLIAFAVQQADLDGPLHGHNWRLLFIVEGIPAFILGLVTIVFLPTRPENTSFLSDGPERDLAVERMNRDAKAEVGGTVNTRHIILALKDWKVYTAGVIYFGLNCALASISAFLPTIIKTFGFTSANAQLLTVPPYACVAVVLTLTAWVSDRLQSRGIACAISSAVAGIGYVLLITVDNNVHVRYFSVFCITSGTYTHIGLIIAWFAHNLGSETKKATGIPMFMAIGQCGSILGSHLFPATEGPHYIKGFAVSCALQFVATICALILTIFYRLENKRRDSVYGRPNPDEGVDTSDLADERDPDLTTPTQTPQFRYIP